MRNTMLALLFGLAVSISAPTSIKAEDHPERYYDSANRDWHNWNDDENRQYRAWLQEQHREYRQFNKLNREQQTEYWRWRHRHEEHEEHEHRGGER